MAQYSLYSETGSKDLGPWVATFSPVTTTTDPAVAWFTEDQEEANTAAEQNPGFVVGPRPHPHH